MKMDKKCIQCGRSDTGLLNPYKPPAGKEFTCSACVIKLLQEKDENEV